MAISKATTLWSTLRAKYQRYVAFKEGYKAKNKAIYVVIDLVETLVVALAIALMLKKFVIQTSIVPTGSMIPTLGINDRLFVLKFSYYVNTPKRGDIVVFRSPHDDGKDYVKRCIGLPGETVTISNGTVYINDVPLALPGVNVQYDRSYLGKTTIPEDAYFVLGDNRGNSQDSRYWGFVPKENLLGKAWFTIWPPRQIRTLR